MPINRWMDKEEVLYIHNGILCSHQKKWNLAICDDMDGTRGYYAERNKSMGERQLSYDLPDMRKWRCNVGEFGGRKRINETRWDREGDKPSETLNLTKQTEGCWRGGRDRVVGLWTLGRVCTMVSAVKCVNLVIHRPVPLATHSLFCEIKSLLWSVSFLIPACFIYSFPIPQTPYIASPFPHIREIIW